MSCFFRLFFKFSSVHFLLFPLKFLLVICCYCFANQGWLAARCYEINHDCKECLLMVLSLSSVLIRGTHMSESCILKSESFAIKHPLLFFYLVIHYPYKKMNHNFNTLIKSFLSSFEMRPCTPKDVYPLDT